MVRQKRYPLNDGQILRRNCAFQIGKTIVKFRIHVTGSVELKIAGVRGFLGKRSNVRRNLVFVITKITVGVVQKMLDVGTRPIDGAEVYKENGEVGMKALRRGNAYHAESRNRKEAAYVSTEKNVWHRHGNLNITKEMENEQVVIVMIDDNGSQYFVILGSTPDLQNKHTISGRATGESIYSILKLEEALVDENDEPLCPPRLMKTIILNNSFSDIIPRIIVQESEEVKDSLKTKMAAVKDFNLLSFIEEAEEDEELNKKYSSKDNSALNHLTDPKLSSQPAVEPRGLANKKGKRTVVAIGKVTTKTMKKRIKNTLKGTKKEPKKVQNYKIHDDEDDKDVVVKTTVGDIELKLWTKETARAYRNFLQLCMEGYWDDTIFHGIIKAFITQDCDPTGAGEGGEIYGEPLKNDEPLCPPRLMKTVILNNTFSDIIPRIIVQESEKVKDSSKTKTAAVNEEAEESEEESVILIKKFSGKDKSARDHLTDPKLRLQPAVASPEHANKKMEGRPQ
ncbi:Peptidyl-prolyl cis-trans isomerase CWC27 like protein [Eufriesea mexicana]|nr:Peptidyl-prolyl cis-trans isomerase CWC27 like protein [Eufriesea mexicana]